MKAVCVRARISSVRPGRRATTRTMALFGGGAKPAPSSLYDIKIKTIDGKDASMDQFKGKVLLIVNVASQCGFTPQYGELVEMYNKYNKDGLEVIAQPCNQFGGQEPASNPEIKAFAERKGAKFPMLMKGDVNGGEELPLWTYLKSKQGGLMGNEIKWNFSKFLVDRQGNVKKRYPSTTPPSAIESDIKSLL